MSSPGMIPNLKVEMLEPVVWIRKPDSDLVAKHKKTGAFMALIFESIQTDGIAQLSYLVGDDTSGIAAVFDPRPDVDCYLQLAREKNESEKEKQ